jgi:hypothetical protein
LTVRSRASFVLERAGCWVGARRDRQDPTTTDRENSHSPGCDLERVVDDARKLVTIGGEK